MSKFKIGDQVRIVRKVESYSDGWENTWTESMDDYLNDGKIHTVTDLGEENRGLRLLNVPFGWPDDALELAYPEHKIVEVHEFKVGSVSYKTLKEARAHVARLKLRELLGPGYYGNLTDNAEEVIRILSEVKD